MRALERGDAAPGPASGFEVVALGEAPLDGLLSALDRTFGPGHDDNWFDWKHRDSPFGPSIGWAAVARGEVIGARLLMRWRLIGPDGEVDALRPVDTATVPEARRQGVFRALAERAVRGAREVGAKLLFNNPNRESRPAYRRLGWSVLGPLATSWHLVGPSPRASLVEDGEALGAIAAASRSVGATGRWVTAHTPDWLSWRYGSGSGRRYGVARLAEAEAPNGIIYRVETRRGVRLLVVVELAGAGRERRRLALSTARREHAQILVAAAGRGAGGELGGPALWRRGPVLAVRALGELTPDPLERSSWALSAGDLEGVI